MVGGEGDFFNSFIQNAVAFFNRLVRFGENARVAQEGNVVNEANAAARVAQEGNVINRASNIIDTMQHLPADGIADGIVEGIAGGISRLIAPRGYKYNGVDIVEGTGVNLFKYGENSELACFYAKQGQQIAGIDIPERTPVNIKKGSYWNFGKKNVEFTAIRNMQIADVEIKPDTNVFIENKLAGKKTIFCYGKGAKIDNYELPGDVKIEITKNRNGQITSQKLEMSGQEQNMQIADVEIKPYTSVVIHKLADGTTKISGNATKGAKIGDYELPGDVKIKITKDQNGQITNQSLKHTVKNQDEQLNGQMLPVGASVTITKSENLPIQIVVNEANAAARVAQEGNVVNEANAAARVAQEGNVVNEANAAARAAQEGNVVNEANAAARVAQEGNVVNEANAAARAAQEGNVINYVNVRQAP